MRVLGGLLLLSGIINNVFVKAQTFACDPCIDRSQYKVKAIFHGVKTDAFWQELEAAAIQSGKDFGIGLDVKLYDTFDPSQMASDIQAIADSDSPPDGLIVTIPSDEVKAAVSAAIEAGIPVFGVNSGYELGVELGVSGWVAQDEYLAGEVAAKEFLKASSEMTDNSTKALFINHEAGNIGIQNRFNGYMDTLLSDAGVTAEMVEVDGTLDTMALSAELMTYFDGCPYEMVLLSGPSLYGAISDLMGACAGETSLGTFDTSDAIFSGISDGVVSFAIEQNQYLQGVIPVLLASSFATTAKIPAPASETEFGTYLSGPSIINSDNVPSSELQNCTSDAFPICPNELAPDGVESECACTDRSKITIGGVLHGVRTDSFWDSVFVAAQTAADDMGVNLLLDRFEPQATDEVLHLKMANKITSLCNQGVDGLFITIPSDALDDAIQGCLDKDIPVISVNAGVDTAESMGLLHHIGQLEYNSGYAAGKQLISNGVVKGWCLNHEASTQTTIERCNGMGAAFNDTDGVEYMGQIIVPRDNDIQYGIDVEFAIADDGDWDGFGFLLVGQIQIPPAVLLLEDHPGVVMGTFDLSDIVFSGLDDGTVLFGIDQQPYLQGYLPVPLLTYSAYTQQSLANLVIESGPAFVTSAPDEDQQVCEVNFYQVCGEESSISVDEIEPSTDPGDGGITMMQSWSTMAKLLSVGLISFIYLFV